MEVRKMMMDVNEKNDCDQIAENVKRMSYYTVNKKRAGIQANILLI